MHSHYAIGMPTSCIVDRMVNTSAINKSSQLLLCVFIKKVNLKLYYIDDEECAVLELKYHSIPEPLYFLY